MNSQERRVAWRQWHHPALKTSSHPLWLWFLWMCAPWRIVFSVSVVTRTSSETRYQPHGKAALDYACRAVERGADGAVVCARVTPWRMRCALRELDRGTWDQDWPWFVTAVYKDSP